MFVDIVFGIDNVAIVKLTDDAQPRVPQMMRLPVAQGNENTGAKEEIR